MTEPKVRRPVELDIELSERNGFLVLAVAGEIDVYTAPQLREAFARITAGELVRNLVMDLTGVTFLDSTGISALVYGRRLLADGAALRLVSTLPAVTRLFTITGLTQVFPVFPTVAAATRP